MIMNKIIKFLFTNLNGDIKLIHSNTFEDENWFRLTRNKFENWKTTTYYDYSWMKEKTKQVEQEANNQLMELFKGIL